MECCEATAVLRRARCKGPAALLGKWLSRFINKKGNLLRKVVTIKYGDDAFGWFPSTTKGSYGYSLWRHIFEGWEGFF